MVLLEFPCTLESKIFSAIYKAEREKKYSGNFTALDLEKEHNITESDKILIVLLETKEYEYVYEFFVIRSRKINGIDMLEVLAKNYVPKDSIDIISKLYRKYSNNLEQYIYRK